MANKNTARRRSTWRGRSTRSTSSAGSRSANRPTRTSSWKSSKTRSTSWRKATSTRTSTSGPKWTGVRSQLANKIQSYQTLQNQTQGPANPGQPSPATINRWTNLVNKGAVIWQVTPGQFARAARTPQKVKSASGALKALRSRFGTSAIKAVTPSRKGGWLVATASQVKGKSFRFPC